MSLIKIFWVLDTQYSIFKVWKLSKFYTFEKLSEIYTQSYIQHFGLRRRDNQSLWSKLLVMLQIIQLDWKKEYSLSFNNWEHRRCVEKFNY